MTEGIFVQEPNEMPEGMTRHSTHRAFSMADAGDTAAYKFNHIQGDVRGTLVPVPSPNGGIKNSINPFGQIVVGTETKLIDGRLQEIPFTPTWLADAVKKGAPPMAPPPPPTPMPSPQTPVENTDGFPDLLGTDQTVAKEAADTKVAEQAVMYKEQAREAVAKQAQAEQELSGLIQSFDNQPEPAPQSQHIMGVSQPQPPAQPPAQPQPQPPAQPPDMRQFAQMIQMMGKQMAQPAQQIPDLNLPQEEKLGYDPTEVASQTVKLSGQFGTSRGKYRFVHKTDGFIVLVYDEDANIFSPPASESTFRLSCNGEEHEVYFAGVEFELPFFKCGVQVMIRS